MSWFLTDSFLSGGPRTIFVDAVFYLQHSRPDSHGLTPGTALYLTTVGPRCAPHTVFDLVL